VRRRQLNLPALALQKSTAFFLQSRRRRSEK
jgi:hypothetical protein